MKNSWKEILHTNIDIEEINKKVTIEREKLKGIAHIYPSDEKIYRCFSYFDVQDTKVVIIGQDPYHQPDQATGLAFWCQNKKKPPSLKNIEKELGKECNIEEWAKQGVLMLNTSLTVRQSSPSDKFHKELWREFTSFIISYLNYNLQKIVFVAFGNNAKIILKDINTNKHYLFITSHPSPLSVNRKLKSYPAFKNSKVFENINNVLLNKINW